MNQPKGGKTKMMIPKDWPTKEKVAKGWLSFPFGTRQKNPTKVINISLNNLTQEEVYIALCTQIAYSIQVSPCCEISWRFFGASVQCAMADFFLLMHRCIILNIALLQQAFFSIFDSLWEEPALFTDIFIQQALSKSYWNKLSWAEALYI